MGNILLFYKDHSMTVLENVEKKVFVELEKELNHQSGSSNKLNFSQLESIAWQSDVSWEFGY
ncbi:hypothetical protein GJU40_08695 [Bacillus lacus]|uniref:Uncharacterized protein n=1 Tax=Metabacillus lacus TaxID=1983721 RepID=A0A7X2IYN7_9BACI|nr:hypothetical protein [Metabacillus lacus]MRX72228.1 hypothetical protein [Metabacillus lacus]